MAAGGRFGWTFGYAVVSVALAGCGSVPSVEPVVAPPAPPPPVDPERYQLHAANTSVEADIKAFTSHRLWFEEVSGELWFDPRVPARSVARVAVRTTTVRARIAAVARVARARFLHVERFPHATFETLALQSGDGGALTAFGALEVRGVRRVIAVPVGLDVDACRVALSSEFTVNRHDFGVRDSSSLDELVADDITVRLRARLPRHGRPSRCR